MITSSSANLDFGNAALKSESVRYPKDIAAIAVKPLSLRLNSSSNTYRSTPSIGSASMPNGANASNLFEKEQNFEAIINFLSEWYCIETSNPSQRRYNLLEILR